MKLELILTPVGHLRFQQDDGNGDESDKGWIRRVAAAFSESSSEGLFALAAARPDMLLPPSLVFWRSFASRYLTELCRTPELGDGQLHPIKTPNDADIESILVSAPPLLGGEYLTAEVICALWRDLDTWLGAEVAASNDNLAQWLKKHAAMWHQVGRVCFHLAENKNDSGYPFAFLATYTPRLSKGGRLQYQPLGKALQEYAGARNKQALVNLLSPVQRAADKIDFVKKLVESGDVFHPLAWTPDEAYLLLKNVQLLEESGLLVRLPDWWRKRPRPRVSVTIGGTKKRSRFNTNAMLDFKIGYALGNESLTEKEWRKIMESADGLAFVKGQWIEVDREKLSQALAHWKNVEAANGAGVSFNEGMRLLAGAPAKLKAEGSLGEEEQAWSSLKAGKWLSELVSNLRDPSKSNSRGPSKNLHGTLRPYQEIGHKWLWLLTNLGLGACLADDMGLGKTIQMISLLLTMKEERKAQSKPSLLVLPASLLSNWKAELRKFAPTIEASFVHPSEMDKANLMKIGEQSGKMLKSTDVVVTTYGMLLRQNWLLDLKWRLVILDEAQAIKNPASRQTKAVKKLNSESRIALTGTPVENRLSDLWSLFDFLCPGLLGSAATFKKFVKTLEARHHDQYAPLRNLVRPYVLRRLKTDKSIITDLPDKTEVKAFCGLAKKQAVLYAKSVGELGAELDGLDGMSRRGLVLAYLMRFKQICNHPSQFLGDGDYDPKDSGKFERLRSICEEIASRQEKVLVFTQFREMTEPIASFLGNVFGRDGLILHGGTAVKKRKSLIDQFQREGGPPFFVLSLKAGGTGLTLTAASHVIHFDRWWNPAVENQATDRAFRIGQHRNVVVHKFIARGTVEEKIDALIEDKSNLADDILKAGAESKLTEMSNEELLKIVALDVNRATA